MTSRPAGPERFRDCKEGVPSLSAASGFANGGAAIGLRDTGGATEVTVSGTVQVGGTIARVGQRLLGSVSKMMMDRFFACLQKRLG